MHDFSLKKSPFDDLFPNVEMIRCVNAPTLIIYPDEHVILKKHGKLLVDNAKNVLDIWKIPGGFSQIEFKQMKEYFQKMTWFFKHIENKQKEISEEELYSMNKAEEWPEDFEHIYKEIKEKMAKIPMPFEYQKTSITGIYIFFRFLTKFFTDFC